MKAGMTTKATRDVQRSSVSYSHALRAICLLLVLLTSHTHAKGQVIGEDGNPPLRILPELQDEGRGKIVKTNAHNAATSTVTSVVSAPAPKSSTTTNRFTQPCLKPGIMVDVVVAASGRKEITEIGKRVSDDGNISLPLVGMVSVEGLTLKELSEHLQSIYRTYLRNPQVYTEFNIGSQGSISPWGSVTILGTVKQPGSVNIPQTQDLTVSRAIQSVGGLDTSADDSSIRITRRNPDGTVKKLKANLHALGSTGELKQDVTLEAGDIVFVPEEFF